MTATTPFSIAIEGMGCASCVGRVEHALQLLDGVEDVTVNLANQSVSITGQPSTISVSKALQNAGYPARHYQLTLSIDGMNCASCLGRVERALLDFPAVLEVSVNLATESACITLLSGDTHAEQLASRLTHLGYPATLKNSGEQNREERRQHEVHALHQMTLIAMALTLPVFLLEMGGHLFPAFHRFIANTIGMQASWNLQFILTSLIMVWPGQSFYTKGFPALFKATPDMNSLVAVGSTAAWAYSVIACFFPSLLPAEARNVYFEAAAVIISLILLGRLLEVRAKGRTGEAIRSLISLQPKAASVERDGVISTVPLSDIVINDIVHIRPGEKIPIDGLVSKGQSYIDESMITGEAEAIKKTVGSSVIGGTINGNGAIRITVSHVGTDTMLAHIIRMVEQAQGSKLPIQSLVNRITHWFVPGVLLIAALTVAFWLLLTAEPSLAHALVAGVSVLIIACPCAMGLAVPTSIMVATGRAAELGVLFRQGTALQQLEEVRIVAFDKTGTLTQGVPELTDMHLADGWEKSRLLPLIAAVESHSEHPIAHALVRAAQLDLANKTALQTEEMTTWPQVEEFLSITGMGVRANVNGLSVLIGADRLMQQEGIALEQLDIKGQQLASQGKSPLYLAIDGKIAAIMAIADPIKSSAPLAIDSLHAMGIKVAMITGDHQTTANSVAKELRIDQVFAEQLPDGKLKTINKLMANGERLAFVGDGINDAPALAAADVGIAIGTGTDVAINSADVVLMSGKLQGVVSAIELSRHTMKNIKQNLMWAFGYNILLIPVAAGALYPFYPLQLSPMLAAAAMALSSIFVLFNASRLRWIKPQLAKA